MPLEFDAAGGVGAGPDVFVGDGVGVLGCDFDAAVGEGMGAFLGPEGVGLEGVGIGVGGGVGAYHCLNSLPCGLSLTLLIMKFARWQYSWARTFMRRSRSFY